MFTNCNMQQIKSTVTSLLSKGKKALLPEKIVTKINNNNGKCGTNSILSNARTKRSGRVTIPYRIVMLNKINNISILEKFEEGLVILLENNDYFILLEKQKEKEDEFSKYLIENIGSDNVVSCVICIRSEKGDSGSSRAREILEKFKPVFEEKVWSPIKRKTIFIKDKDKDKEKENKRSLITEGNSKWEGEYYYDISGGDQITQTSHPEKSKDIQLFNEYFDYANETECFNIDCVMLYFILHCHDINIYIPEDDVDKMKKNFEEYFITIDYEDGNILNDEIIPDCLIHNEEMNKTILYCPITLEPISIKYLEIESSKENNSKEHNYIDICHNEARSKELLYYDKKQNIILTGARARNLFWGTHLGNMQQQDFTIKEYVENEEKKYLKRKNLTKM